MSINSAPWPAVAAALAAAVCCGSVAAATEYGTVVSSTPVYGPITVADRLCTEEPAATGPRPSGAGAAVGAVVGGVVGNQFGHGMGRAAATGLGVVIGSVVGNQAEANSAPPPAPVQSCRTVNRSEDRVVAWDVVYDYAGARRSARLGQDPGGPGSRIPVEVQVTPSGAGGYGAAPAGGGAVGSSGRVGTPVPLAGSPDVDRAARGYGPAPRGDEVGVPAARAVYAYPPPAYVVPAPVYMAPAPVYYGPPVGASIFIGGRWGGHHGRW